MQAKTKLQKQVVDLSAKLKPITQKQKDWAVKALSANYAVMSRNRTFCLDCGHKWDEGLKLAYLLEFTVCPNCNQKLSYEQNNQISHESTYFAILTTKRGMQVVRMFLFRQLFKKNQKTECRFEEVMQHWITEDGKSETLSRPVNNSTYQIDQWTYGPFEIRSNTERHWQRFLINPYKIYPVRRILPIIRRNGFKGHFYTHSPQELFCLLLKNNKAETLYKTQQFDMLSIIESRHDQVSKYWNSIKICIRNGYKILDAINWLDYLNLLEYFEKDIRSPKYICPGNFNNEHDRLVSKKMKIENEKRKVEEEKKFIEYQEQYNKQKGKFFGLKFEDQNLIIQTISSIPAFKEEAETLKHCVYSNEYFKKENSLIMSAKVNGKPVETIEISLRDLRVIQSRGLQNKASKYNKEILALLQKNISQIAKIKEVETSEIAA